MTKKEIDQRFRELDKQWGEAAMLHDYDEVYRIGLLIKELTI